MNVRGSLIESKLQAPIPPIEPLSVEAIPEEWVW